MSEQQIGVRQSAVLDVSELLTSCWPKHAAKKASQAAEVSPRTAEDWIAKRREPSMQKVWKMAARSAELRACLIQSLAELDRVTQGKNDNAEVARTGHVLARGRTA